MLDGGFVDQATVFLSLVCEFGPRLGHVEQFQFGVECCVSSQRLHHFPASTLAIASSVLRSAGPTLHKLGNHFLRRRFLVSSDVPSAIAFCRTAPSVRPNLPAICLAGAFFAKDLSSRMSFAFHPRRFPFLPQPSVISSPYSVISAARSRYFLKASQEGVQTQSTLMSDGVIIFGGVLFLRIVRAAGLPYPYHLPRPPRPWSGQRC